MAEEKVPLRASIVRKCVERGKGKGYSRLLLWVPLHTQRKLLIQKKTPLFTPELWLSLFQKRSHGFFVILALEKIVQTKGFGLHRRIKIAGRSLHQRTF